MKKGHHYLIGTKYGIAKCKCLDVTKTCYQIKWEQGEVVWLFKKDFEAPFPTETTYTIIEDLD